MLTATEILKNPLPHQSKRPLSKALLRLLLLCSRRQLIAVDGGENLCTARDPFILALNHSQYLEAILVPAYLCWARDGSLIRFLSDWNFQLVPGVRTLLRRADVIPVRTKLARPRFLTPLRNILVTGTHGYEEAKQTLRRGKSVGIFVEGTRNRNPHQLLAGHRGAARLAIETGTTVIPAGIRYPRMTFGKRISQFAAISIHCGSPLQPGTMVDPAPPHEVIALHDHIMQSIAELSGKKWTPNKRRFAYGPLHEELSPAR